jgi:hypothetical protein
MITSKNCMNLILQRYPNFKTIWEKHLAEWGDEEPGLLMDMDAFVYYTLILIKDKHIEEVKDIFLFVEKLLVEGDENVKNAVKVVYLEHLINLSDTKALSPEDFVYLLGEQSRLFCRAWDEFSGVKTRGLWSEDK